MDMQTSLILEIEQCTLLIKIVDKSKIEQSDYDNVVFPFTMLGWELGRAIIPVVYTMNEWLNSKYLPFYKNVESDKIVI